MLIAKGIHVTQSLEYSTIINVAAVIFPLLIMLFADRYGTQMARLPVVLRHRRVWHAGSPMSTAPWALIALGRLPGDVGAMAVVRAAQLPGGAVPDADPRPRRRVRLLLEQAERHPDAVLHRVLPARFGVPGVFAFVAVCMAIVIVAVATLGPRTRLLEVEAIAH